MKDFSHWYTKERAASALNCSTKTLERLVSQGRIHMEIWKRPAGAAISVYNPKEVDRESQRRNPGPKAFVLPPEDRTAQAAIVASNPLDIAAAPVRELVSNSPEINGNTGLALSVMSKTVEALAKLQQNGATLPVDRKLFLSRKEAAAYTGLPQSTIVAAINAGVCKAVRTGRGIRVVRESLDSLELAAFLDTFEPPAPRPAPPRRSKGDLISSAAAASNLVMPGVEPSN